MVIESAGIHHELWVSIERTGDVAVVHDTTECSRTVGTSVTVPLPAEMDVDPVRWAAGAALVNPHAAINVIKPDHSDDDSAPVFYKPSDRAWSK